MQPAIKQFADCLAAYAGRWPAESALVSLYLDLLGEGLEAFRRERAAGHFTGSAWLLSADGRRVLLTHHRKLGRWLQLGGHADGDSDLAAVALREAQEESGLSGLLGECVIFDLDRHRIPARGHEPKHWHYDVRYVVRCSAGEDFVVGPESHALRWRPVRELAEAADADQSLRRMAIKWMQRCDRAGC